MRGKQVELGTQALRATAALWLFVMIAIPLLQSLSHVIFPPDNAPLVMAKYMDDNIPKDALIETWEPEMGFLTDHNYHYPPQILLDTAVGFKWRGGPAPSEKYDFIAQSKPEYVLAGQFGTWVQMYPDQLLENGYTLLYEEGGYRLYHKKGE